MEKRSVFLDRSVHSYSFPIQILKYKDVILDTLKLLRDKALSKRGFSWSGKLLSSVLLTLTHTYPLENKFVNPDEWSSEHFQKNHHRYWGKLYHPDEVKVRLNLTQAAYWGLTTQRCHGMYLTLRKLTLPSKSSESSLSRPWQCWRNFSRLVCYLAFFFFLQPLLINNFNAVEPEHRDSIWRNDFCRYLTIVRNAFSGTPTLLRENATIEELNKSCDTSDIL